MRLFVSFGCGILGWGGGLRAVKGIYEDSKLLGILGYLGEKKPGLEILCLFCVLTGVRVSDALKLQKGSFRAAGELREGKTGKIKAWCIPSDLYGGFIAHSEAVARRGADLIFPYSRQLVHRWMRRAGVAVGLGGIGCHSMRKTYAWNVLRASGCIYTVQAALNHKYVSTTVLYLVDGVRWLMGEVYDSGPVVYPSFLVLQNRE